MRLEINKRWGPCWLFNQRLLIIQSSGQNSNTDVDLGSRQPAIRNINTSLFAKECGPYLRQRHLTTAAKLLPIRNSWPKEKKQIQIQAKQFQPLKTN